MIRNSIALFVTSLSIGFFAVSTHSLLAQQPTESPNLKPQERSADVPYVPTPYEVVNEMLELGQVKPGDVLYDLGSGDGRIVITAAKEFGTQGVGIEINPRLVEEARQNAQAAGVSDRVQFLQQDLFQTDLSDASVVTLYLLPDVNLKLRPKLLCELKPGTRIVSHSFSMGEWKPDRVVTIGDRTRRRTLYYWVVPEQIPASLSEDIKCNSSSNRSN